MSPLVMASNDTGVGKNGKKNADFPPINRYISETIKGMAYIITMKN